MTKTMQASFSVTTKPFPSVPTSTRLISPVDEARNLAQLCAEPRPAGDNIKAAIARAAKRLGFTRARVKAIWYSEARRIDAHEMDRLRRCAAGVDFDQAMAGVKILRNRLAMAASPKCRELVDAIDAALYSARREGSGDPCVGADEAAAHERNRHHD